MGWCSGTYPFDAVAAWMIETIKDENQLREGLVILRDSLQNQDWDCEGDTDHAAHPIVREVLGLDKDYDN